MDHIFHSSLKVCDGRVWVEVQTLGQGMGMLCPARSQPPNAFPVSLVEHELYIYIYTILGVSHPKTIGFPIQIHQWKIVQLANLFAWDVAARSFSMILLPAALRGGRGSF